MVCRSQWPHGLRRRSAAARLLRSWVRIPPRAWMFVCCVLSGRGLCDGLIIRSEESYRLWRVVVCDHETSQARRLKPARGLRKKNLWSHYLLTYLLIYSMEQSPRKANRFSGSQENLCILWKVHYLIYKCRTTVPILNQINPVHAPSIPLPDDPS